MQLQLTSSLFFPFPSPEIITALKGHTGLVKGLTWDPVGKYIASQADDRSLKVWRTMDWQLETNITKPFNEVRLRAIGFKGSHVSWFCMTMVSELCSGALFISLLCLSVMQNSFDKEEFGIHFLSVLIMKWSNSKCLAFYEV